MVLSVGQLSKTMIYDSRNEYKDVAFGLLRCTFEAHIFDRFVIAPIVGKIPKGQFDGMIAGFALKRTH